MAIEALSAQSILSTLIYAGNAAAFELYELANDDDVPVYPESLIHIHAARALRQRLKIANIELEAPTDRIIQALSGRSPGSKDFPTLTRPGLVDIVGWDGLRPQLFVEVKDQVGSSGDGIVEDLERLVEIMRISHRLERKSTDPAPVTLLDRARYLPTLEKFGGLVYFVGRNAKQFKKGRHLASQFLPFATRTVNTTVKKLKNIVANTEFDIRTRYSRVMDSAKDGPPDPALVATEFEETISGSEQFTLCVACVLHLRPSGGQK